MPEEILSLARQSGFDDVHHVSTNDLAARYFSNRTDELRPPSNAEEFLLALKT